jgi:predicted Na+-dependent transporter
MLSDLIKIALLCVVIGGASIPASFTINDSPTVVWIGNALGSLFSAIVVICISNRITNQRFKNKASRWRVVLISTIAVYVLDLDKRIYKRWMFTGIFFASGAYVYGYWWLFLK